MLSIDSFSRDLRKYLEPAQIEQVRKAYFYADDAHKGQKRKSGEAYITHPLAVSAILAEMHMDHQCLIAALLHDVIEDTGIPKHTLAIKFNEEVSHLVDGVSKLKTMFQSRAEAQAENFQKMTLAMTHDIRVILVKIADRLHNMRTLGHLESEKRRRIAKETLEIYAPIAYRLGMNNIRIELEELGFKALYPLRSSMIDKAVRRARGNRKEVLVNIRKTIEGRLLRESISAQVFGREKHLFSIYQKMKSKSRSFVDIMDVYAYRIIVDSADTCYRVLGSMHNLYKPKDSRFKDYIAIPKNNGYQSLHTTLIGMHGIPIEIQIRTPEMDMVANNGIAGHWLYKSNDDSINGSHQRAREWMKGLLSIQQSTGSSLEFTENVKMDLFPNEVYVFSPKGEIYDLSQGATPVDFAYTVHTDIGNTCVACHIDRKPAPLSTLLESGQTVKIITAPDASPNPAWLSFVITGKARASILHTLKHQHESQSISLGKRLLDHALRAEQVSLDDIDAKQLQKVLTERNFDNIDKLFAALGQGKQMSYVITRALLGNADDLSVYISDPGKPLPIMGTEGLVITYAKCCKPIPGDPIIGHISVGRGIVIHSETCHNMRELHNKPKEIMAVHWDPKVSQEFTVGLRIEVENEKGIIAILASYITGADANIERIHIEEKDARLSTISMVLAVRDRLHLANVIKRLRTIKSITKLTRTRG